jgi:2,4-dienoyl-CoA reductase-like NADH-dependent reductase (Old Yellow Enzyme family)
MGRNINWCGKLDISVAGLMKAGNVHTDEKYLGGPGDLAFGQATAEAQVKETWKEYAAACHAEGAPAMVQVCHPGRQSVLGAGKKGFWDKNMAPSPIPLNIGSGPVAWMARGLVFGTPKEMTTQDVKDVIGGFVNAAKVVQEAGFNGMQLHGAHGYLIGVYRHEAVGKRDMLMTTSDVPL